MYQFYFIFSTIQVENMRYQAPTTVYLYAELQLLIECNSWGFFDPQRSITNNHPSNQLNLAAHSFSSAEVWTLMYKRFYVNNSYSSSFTNISSKKLLLAAS